MSRLFQFVILTRNLPRFISELLVKESDVINALFKGPINSADATALAY